MRPTAHLPKLIAVTVLLACLIAAPPAVARRPSQAVVPSTALTGVAEKAPFLYESIFALVLLKTPSFAIFNPSQLIEPTRKTPNVQIFEPEQLVEPTRKTPSHPIFRPPQLIEPVRKTPSLEIFRPDQIGR
jgi:hypothetical protein